MVDNGFMEKYFSSLTFHPFSPSLSSMFEFICCLLMTSSPWTLCREKYNIHAGALGRTVPQIILVMTWNVTRLQKLRPSSENWLSFLSTSQQDCSWIISHTSSVSQCRGCPQKVSSDKTTAASQPGAQAEADIAVSQTCTFSSAGCQSNAFCDN